MRARFLGKDPDSQEGQFPTLFATDRTDRVTYIALPHVRAHRLQVGDARHLQVRERDHGAAPVPCRRAGRHGLVSDLADHDPGGHRGKGADSRASGRSQCRSPTTVRFGVFCSEYTNAAGEDIRYLPRQDAAGLPDYDYWLFDSSKLVRMHFDDDENFLSRLVLTGSAMIVSARFRRAGHAHS